MITVHVSGRPRPQPRPRHVLGRPIPVSTMDKGTRKYREAVIAAMRREIRAGDGWPKQKAVALYARLDLFFETRDKARWGKPHLARPDADNLAKLWMDCAQRAGLIHDDSQIAGLVVSKKWAESPAGVLCLSDNESTLNATVTDADDDLGA